MSWWRESVFYHIYVRSFLDTDGDGVGDLQGVLDKIEYFGELGVNAIWLSPFYPSPLADFGYDISDYRAVDPRYGSMETLGAIRDALHGRGMRLIFDFVPNHTSRKHPWFKEALKGPGAPTRDFYIWREPGPDGGPPNNWVSVFGGPAWTLDRRSGEYYLHSFLADIPDLNWRNPDLRRAMLDHMRFWLDWGVDGFSVDAVPHLLKDPGFRSNPLRAGMDPGAVDPFRAQEHLYDVMTPGVHDVIKALRGALADHPEAILVGDTTVADLNAYAGFLRDGVDQLHLAFNFPMLRAQELGEIRSGIEEAEKVLHPRAWPTLCLSNHDGSRHVSRLGLEETEAGKKLTAAMLLLPRGTPFLYYGEELGLPDARIPDAAIRDPLGRFELKHQHKLSALPARVGYGRDGARAPLPWTPEGGFTTGSPWLPAYDPARINVEAARRDPDSVWSFYRELLTLRRACPSLRRGRMIPREAPEGLWAFTRSWGGADLHVCLNLTDQPIEWSGIIGQVALGSHRPLGERLEGGRLAPYEALVLS